MSNSHEGSFFCQFSRVGLPLKPHLKLPLKLPRISEPTPIQNMSYNITNTLPHIILLPTHYYIVTTIISCIILLNLKEIYNHVENTDMS